MPKKIFKFTKSEIKRAPYPDNLLMATWNHYNFIHLGTDVRPENITPEETSTAEEVLQRVEDAIGALTRIHAETVVRNYYEKHRTLESIGREIGVTSERVRQIKQQALFKLARALWAESKTT